jgi:hypothetical protein
VRAIQGSKQRWNCPALCFLQLDHRNLLHKFVIVHQEFHQFPDGGLAWRRRSLGLIDQLGPTLEGFAHLIGVLWAMNQADGKLLHGAGLQTAELA